MKVHTPGKKLNIDFENFPSSSYPVCRSGFIPAARQQNIYFPISKYTYADVYRQSLGIINVFWQKTYSRTDKIVLGKIRQEIQAYNFGSLFVQPQRESFLP
jgi:hypothetical protein